MATRPKESPNRHRKIGPCRVVAEIGRGGMAQIYRGLHELLNREVAIKELLPESSADPEAMERFRREARALAAFRHQNIVTLYDLVEKNGSYFMIMEYVDGPTLAELLRQGPLPPLAAAVIAARVASALDHAHFNRIIHRDLKPSNVMIDRSGEVKLMDFGIAREEGRDVNEALTREGVAVGTPSYMSPEQVAGAAVDPRSDVFSLGVVLYECLAGERPFTGATAGDVFARIQKGKYRSLRRAAPGTPRALRRIVRRALKVKPERRYFDAGAVRRDLDAYVARELNVSPAAFLLAFLRHRNRISESEALARLSRTELAVIDSFDLPPKRGVLRWAMAAGAVVGTALYFTQQYWLPLLQRI